MKTTFANIGIQFMPKGFAPVNQAVAKWYNGKNDRSGDNILI
jgi:hypothetical protein